MNGSDAGPTADTTYGVLQLGHAQVALPLEALREVIPCPAQFAGLPATAPGLCGAVNLRGKVVPVLDLRGLLGLQPAPVSDPVVALLRHERRLIGLRADGVRGITRPDAAVLHAMQAGAGGLLFSGSFERPEDASVVSVLDPQAVLALPGVPALREHADATRAAAERPAATRRPLMLVRCGAIGLGFDVTDIHTTLPRVTLKPSCLGGAVCRGVIEHGDVELPAVDPLALLALGSLPQGGDCQALLLRFEQGLVAVLVSEVIDIVQVADDELLALPPLALRRPECFRAMLRVDGRGEHLVLAPGALQAQPDLLALAGMNTRRAGGEAAEASRQATRALGRAVITFDAGAEVATPLTDVREIVPLPAGRAQPEASHPAIVGLFSHRGHAVTLMCLATLLGRPRAFDEGSARVLLVGTQGSAFGFVVPRLCHIESTVWEQPPETAVAGRAFGQHPLIEVGANGQRRTLPLLDLPTLARQALAGAAMPARAPEAGAVEPARGRAAPAAGAEARAKPVEVARASAVPKARDVEVRERADVVDV